MTFIQYKTSRLLKFSYIATLLIFFCSCRKFITIDPPHTSMVEETVFQNESTTAAVLRGAYNTTLRMHADAAYVTMSQLNALYTDEYRLTKNDVGLSTIYLNAPNAEQNATNQIWSNAYNIIYKANAVIEGVEKHGVSMEKGLKDHFLGEAKFIRAYAYFLLVNTYGDVPLLLTTAYEQNRKAPRTSQADVYDLVIKDLTDAKAMMKSDYLNWSNVKATTKFRANKDVAAALLARVYLYKGEWNKAEASATEVITKTGVFSLEAFPANVFDISSKEFILSSEGETTHPAIALAYQLPSPVPFITVFGIGVISDTLLKSFEEGDNRKKDWVGSYTSGGNIFLFANKYKTSSVLTQYISAIRLAELYLIRAEARMEQGKLVPAIEDLNIIRARARAAATTALPNPLPPLPATLSKEQIRSAMEKERFTELFIEGHRWFDLKRWKGLNNPAISRADEVMPAIAAKKGSTWHPDLKLLPIPQLEIDLNKNLVQNPGY